MGDCGSEECCFFNGKVPESSEETREMFLGEKRQEKVQKKPVRWTTVRGWIQKK
jgi:hypothetical protein